MRPGIFTTIGLILLMSIGVFYLAFGALYASVDDFLFFHKAALPAGASAAVLPLYLGLMKLIGGASIATGGLGLFVLFTSVKARRRFALGALVAAWASPLFFAAYVAETLRAETGAPTSATLMAILLAILVVGALAFAGGRKSPSTGEAGPAC